MLNSKTIFITGATAGFGLACAKLFVSQGAKVVATGRRGDRLSALKKELGDAVHTLAFDVGDRAAVEKAVASLPKGFSEVDVLVNNAGGALGMGSFDQAELGDAERMIEANILGVIYCTHAIVPGMVARGGGHIVNISSVAGSYPYPGGNV
jgi:3-hydroxy acid dehydrogenase/malonic semialdehyde reductase